MEAVIGREASRSEGEQHDTDRVGEEVEAGVSLKRPLRAMDVGCAVGGIAFELTRSFDEVRGEGAAYERVFGERNKTVKFRLTKSKGGEDPCSGFWRLRIGSLAPIAPACRYL